MSWRLLTLATATIAVGELPLEPELTPGLGVAGAILIVTGAAYALVGIRTRWVHCFFSVAFLAAVSVTVLIIYVMSPPIKNAVQGAYVVAVVCTGVILGGAGLIFRDVLECLGCLLGGFCLAMWLLTLKAGGLTGSGGTGTVIFICIFSGAGFAGYFSRWTRPQYMIACMALNGATAAVIGIDCFSRAGLKEFWMWIWNLNDNIFPYDANTYPLTRGIRVEQAVTIILMLAGVISQSKLWNVIKERKAQKEAERRKGQEAVESADLKAGDEIEKINAEERRQWEAVHGDMKSPTSVHTAQDSGVGDLDSKKSRHSGTATHRSVSDNADEIEMAELPAEMPTESSDDEQRPRVPPKPKTAAEQVMGKNDKDGMVTVRVAVDEVVTTPVDESGDVANNENEVDTRLSLKPSTQPSRSGPRTPVPEVVPLPFKVPQIETDDQEEDGNRSSFATFDHLEDELPVRQSIDSKRSSFAKRLSTSSTNLLRRLSHNSLAKQLEAAHGPSESQEELTMPVRADRDSIAATFDEESSLGEEDARSRYQERPFSTEITAEHTTAAKQEDEAVDDKSKKATESVDKGKQKAEDDVDSKQGKSVTAASEADSKAASLTKDRLPRALSKIALSYRTNEWAKHLSHAEIPTPEELQILEPVEPQVADAEEAAAPVNVDDLRKTAENAAPPPAMPRTVSVMSMQQMKNQAQASSAQRSANLMVPAAGGSPPLSPSLSAQGHLSPNQPSSKRSSARTVGGVGSEEEEAEPRLSSESRQAAVRAAAAALTGESTPGASPSLNNTAPGNLAFRDSRPPVPGVVSYNSPQSLIAKRDMVLRAKNQALNRPESNLRSSSTMQAVNATNNPAYGTVSALGPGRMSSYAEKQKAAVDLDDVPLNQRKAYIKGDSRRNSMSSSNGNKSSPGEGVVSGSRPSSFAQKRSDLPSQVARESQMINNDNSTPYIGAGIRQSSSSFLQTNAAGPSNVNTAAAAAGGPLINQVYGIPGTSSSNSLLPHQTTQVWDAEVRRDIDMQRQFLMNQKEVEARQRESMRAQKESMGRRIERRMRTDSQMMEAHREAMRKMQRDANRQG